MQKNTSMEKTLTALAAVPDIGRAALAQVNTFQLENKVSWDEMWSQLLAGTTRTPLTRIQSESLKVFAQRYSPATFSEYLESLGVWSLLADDAAYPHLLQQLPDKPEVLFVQGELPEKSDVTVAVVGTRHPTTYGQVVTKKITGELAEFGCVIVSGFMYGIDQVAHQAALDHGGRTVAVLGYGCQRMNSYYFSVRDRILSTGGAVLSEYPPEYPATHGTFPARNRIIAGMSRAVVVTEAAAKSGSLITARQAGEYGREVCAVPGAITSQYSDGTRALLNEGAKLVGSAAQVLETIGIKVGPVVSSLTVGKFGMRCSPFAEKIRQQLLTTACSPEELSSSFQLPISLILGSLTELELAGLAKSEGEKWQVTVY